MFMLQQGMLQQVHAAPDHSKPTMSAEHLITAQKQTSLYSTAYNGTPG
jgi:hypothetical protein